jgi:hypothetical protein
MAASIIVVDGYCHPLHPAFEPKGASAAFAKETRLWDVAVNFVDPGIPPKLF